MICCVRNPARILNSFESLIRRNAFELSGIFNYDSGGTVYSRVEGLASPAGMFGFAYNALREAVYGEQSNRLLIVRYESMVANPLGTLAAIYGFIGDELARIVGEAQERDAEEERRFEDSALGRRRKQPPPRRRGSKGR